MWAGLRDVDGGRRSTARCFCPSLGFPFIIII